MVRRECEGEKTVSWPGLGGQGIEAVTVRFVEISGMQVGSFTLTGRRFPSYVSSLCQVRRRERQSPECGASRLRWLPDHREHRT